jgi:hypothetical protein
MTIIKIIEIFLIVLICNSEQQPAQTQFSQKYKYDYMKIFLFLFLNDNIAQKLFINIKI